MLNKSQTLLVSLNLGHNMLRKSQQGGLSTWFLSLNQDTWYFLVVPLDTLVESLVNFKSITRSQKLLVILNLGLNMLSKSQHGREILRVSVSSRSRSKSIFDCRDLPSLKITLTKKVNQKTLSASKQSLRDIFLERTSITKLFTKLSIKLAK